MMITVISSYNFQKQAPTETLNNDLFLASILILLSYNRTANYTAARLEYELAPLQS